jgi:hypothetical protein
MNRATILRLLELQEDSPIHLLRLDMQLWGRNLVFTCQAQNILFYLIFSDCSESRWRHYLHHESSPEAFPPSELLNFRIGRNQGRSPAQLLTEHFGLSLVYGDLFIEWGEKRVPLAEG